MSSSGLAAEIITIGNEVLSGHTINTNAAAIARALGELGVAVHWTTTVGDDGPDIVAAFRTAWERARVIVTTGGLGPTHDDITRTAFCETFGRKLVRDDAVLANVKERFAKLGRPMTDRNVDQALVPTDTETMMNRWGTAPGVYLKQDGRHWFMLPGVPREMVGLMEHEVVPRVRAASGGGFIARRELHVVGVPESFLMDRIDGIPGLEQVASLPDGERFEVTLRITVSRADETAANAEVDRLGAALRERLGDDIYGQDADSLESVVGKMLAEREMTVALGESCTGGLAASRLTDVSGSSRYVTLGIVAYSNTAKETLLGVQHDLIVLNGAVSEPVAQAMATGARRTGRADIGIGITGIAGPTGGTAEKPVGLVYVALAHEGGAEVHRYVFGGDRITNKRRAATAAIDIVRRHLLGSGDGE